LLNKNIDFFKKKKKAYFKTLHLPFDNRGLHLRFFTLFLGSANAAPVLKGAAV